MRQPPAKPVFKVCEVCGNDFQTVYKVQKYCGDKCRNTVWNVRRTGLTLKQYQEEQMKKYLERIREQDTELADFMKEHKPFMSEREWRASEEYRRLLPKKEKK